MAAQAHAQALYRRWRPQTFDDVIGQEHITHTLHNAVAHDRLAQAYLFTGPRGTGKTSVARILAKAVNCTGEGGKPCNDCAICRSMTAGRSLDLIEIDAASNTGVDDVRELRDKISFAPNEATYKVYIVDEVHMLSTAAFNALLKTLEEPPPHAFFILATTEPHKIPDTILSRCQRFDFRRVALPGLVGKLERICAAEDVTAEPAALEAIARSATGSIRDAESLLDQLIATGEAVTADDVRDALGTPTDDAVSGLVDALMAGNAADGLRLINAALDRGADPRQFQSRLLDHLRALLLIQTGIETELLNVPSDQLQHMQVQADRLPTPALVDAIHRFNEARPSADLSQPSLPLELALVESVLALGAGDAVTARSAEPVATKPPPAQRSAAVAAAPATEPTATRPVTAEPSAAEPAATEPATTEPATTEPATTEPATTEPATTEPATTEPAAAAPEPGADVGTPPPVPATAGGAASPAQALAQVKTTWPDIVEAVSQRDKNTAALLKDCRPVAADEDSVTLGFYYEFHCQRVSEKRRNTLVSEAVSEVLGAPHTLRCTVVPPHGDTDERPRTLADQAKQDPVVRHAVEELGGRITGVTRDPEDS